MEYRSVTDLNAAIFGNLRKIPRDIDVIVGVPRSGLLVANLLSLAINVPMADLEGFCEGRLLSAGRTKRTGGFKEGRESGKIQNILLIDDSINSGKAIRAAYAQIISAYPSNCRVITCAVYGLKFFHEEVDIVLEAVPQPRLFQWNYLHHPILENTCFDIDGVLCCDPEFGDNDDGERYVTFLAEARPYLRPTRKIGHLVTSRLERYRPETEAWLSANGIEYGKLWMLDLPSAKERRHQKAHAVFKARVYSETRALLFIESEPRQARDIARDTGKPVLCVETQDIIMPDKIELRNVYHSMLAARQRRRKMSPTARWKASAKTSIKRILAMLKSNSKGPANFS
jgi:uncharacterized HAD superfamily protein/hypoxanthine phosphoribosyltransferase